MRGAGTGRTFWGMGREDKAAQEPRFKLMPLARITRLRTQVEHGRQVHEQRGTTPSAAEVAFEEVVLALVEERRAHETVKRQLGKERAARERVAQDEAARRKDATARDLLRGVAHLYVRPEPPATGCVRCNLPREAHE